MNAIKAFLKTTLVGGLVFLVPIVLLSVVLGHAMRLAGKIAAPIAVAFPASQAAGVAVTTLVAACILLLVAFAAGLVAHTAPGRRITRWFEDSILGGLPQYRMIRSMAEGLAQVEDGRGMQPVLVRGDDGWQLGYRIEELHGGWVAVFLPQAPTPMSGNVLYIAAANVQPLDITMPEAIRLVKSLGIGSAAALRRAEFGTQG
jgi:uncharacterized membrane protein